MSCTYIKQDGTQCCRGIRGEFTMCGAHRAREPSRAYVACQSCGVATRRIVDGVGLCVRDGCGLNLYRRELRQRNNAKKFVPPPEVWINDDPPVWLNDEPAVLASSVVIPPPPIWTALNPEARVEIMAWLKAC